MKTIVIVAILALFAVPVGANGVELPTTVAEFVSVLETPEDPVFYAWAIGYIWGVDAGLFVAHSCYVGATDPETQNEQMAAIFVDFANQHKDKWEEPNAIHFLTAAALMEAFPCKEGRELKL